MNSPLLFTAALDELAGLVSTIDELAEKVDDGRILSRSRVAAMLEDFSEVIVGIHTRLKQVAGVEWPDQSGEPFIAAAGKAVSP